MAIILRGEGDERGGGDMVVRGEVVVIYLFVDLTTEILGAAFVDKLPLPSSF